MADVKIKMDLDKVLQKRFEDVNNSATMYAMHNTLAKMCDPYVPFLNGPLSQTHEISSTGVKYIQPYARYQYYGDHFNHTLEFHPLASARWDKAMLKDRGDEFYREIELIMRERLRTMKR